MSMTGTERIRQLIGVTIRYTKTEYQIRQTLKTAWLSQWPDVPEPET